MFLKRGNLITFSGPMLQGDFSDDIDDYTKNEFFDNLSKNCIEIPIEQLSKHNEIVEGMFLGGNLSTFASLGGMDFLPDEKFIFFGEDINEPVYKIDRYFHQLFNIEKFRKNVVGIVIGDFIGVDDDESFKELLDELSTKYQVNIVKTSVFSHSKIKTTVPCGAAALIDNDKIIIKDYLI